MTIKVSIADDHPVVLEGIRTILNESADVVVENIFSNGRDLLENLKKSQPDVLLLDIHMPSKQGNELAREINKEYPEIAILTLTNMDQSFHVQSMFESGARGYLLKTSGRERILEAIFTVYQGDQYVDPVMREIMVKELLAAKVKNQNIPVLSEREKEILQLIVDEFTTQQIAEKLFLSHRTIEHHRNTLLFKLDVKNTAGLVKKALQMGIAK